MDTPEMNCPLTSEKTLQRYFIENRSRLIDIAAYLDRIERSQAPEAVLQDFRLVAFKKAIAVLLGHGSKRVEKIQKILSDITDEPLPEAGEQKSAVGAFQHVKSECC
jgi:hypothetical protein